MTVAELAAGIARSTGSDRLLRALRVAAVVAGPAFAVSVGYVDPGNWATDLAAGRYGDALLWSVVLASLIAMAVQVVAVHVTLATDRTFGAVLAMRWPRMRGPFFVLGQIAAIATDLAEFSGIVLGLRLIFHLPLAPAAGIGVLIVLGLLALGNRGLRRVEIALMTLIAVIVSAYLYEVTLVHPEPAQLLRGALVPTFPGAGAIALVVGIVGATVMPHNIFLHSLFIRERFAGTPESVRARGRRTYTLETVIALGTAMLVNAAILVVGAAMHGAGGSIAQAYRTLLPVAGGAAAAVFGAALLSSGIAASSTATLAGDSITHDLSPVAIPRLARRLATLLPAPLLLLAGADINVLLIWSQVALALILPFTLVPLIACARDRSLMGRFVLRGAFFAVAATAVAICIALDLALLVSPIIRIG